MHHLKEGIFFRISIKAGIDHFSFSVCKFFLVCCFTKWLTFCHQFQTQCMKIIPQVVTLEGSEILARKQICRILLKF